MTKFSRRWIITTLAGILALVASAAATASPVWPVMDTSTFIAKSTELLVVRCLNPDVQGTAKNNAPDEPTLIDVEVLVVLKGQRKVGNTKLATMGQRMEKGQRYLLANFGGSAFDTGFLAQSAQSVVELPLDFDLKSLHDVVLVQQVQSIFDARRFQVETLIRQLEQEKAMLDQTATNSPAPKD